MALSIPPKNRIEWRKMLTGEIEHNFQNYVLQLRVYQMRKELNLGKVTMDRAINEIYELCSKYSMAVQSDFKTIFKSW